MENTHMENTHMEGRESGLWVPAQQLAGNYDDDEEELDSVAHQEQQRGRVNEISA